MQHVFLVPGFFGFSNLGGVVYFAHVREFLETRLAAEGTAVAVHPVPTDPTASLTSRAMKILDAMEQVGVGATDDVHLIGHSTGGLDARLLTSPGVSLDTGRDVEARAAQVRSVITVATPHHGTAVASFFNSLFGQKLLSLLSVATIYSLRHGPLPLSMLIRLGALFARLDDHLGFRNTVLDHLFDELLREFTPDRREAIESLLAKMNADSTLLGQLAPEAIELLNAVAPDRAGTRYGSVVCATPAPGLRSAVGVGLDPYAQTTHALYVALFRITAGTRAAAQWSLEPAKRDAVATALGFVPDDRSNDGIVPLHSQPWGEIIHATNADHLDVVGHFAGVDREPPHRDWFSSGSTFRHAEFEALWGDVARFVLHAIL